MFLQYIIEFDVYNIVFDINIEKELDGKLKVIYSCCFDVVMTFKDIFNYILWQIDLFPLWVLGL